MTSSTVRVLAAVASLGVAVTVAAVAIADQRDDAASPSVPYLATPPVDLSGMPDVSEAEVAEAEALVTEALEKLPRFADIATLVALGYRTIGDVSTGYEHFVNWELISDGRVLDPDHPESLVFTVDPDTGEKTLGGAMFMANPDDTLDTVPDLGGALVQWHVHDNLCFEGERHAWRVADVIPPGQDCRPSTFRLAEIAVPMVHVWIIPRACGPFAALEDEAAGQVRPGEERLCDHVHGSH